VESIEMRLHSSDGASLEVKILGYEFPDIETEEYDSNWLVIEIDATHPSGHWVCRDSCLLTYEVAALANWLAGIPRGQDVSHVQRFIEPNLEFRLIEADTSRTLRIYFEAECRPDGAPWNQGVVRDLWLDFPVSELNLEEAAESLRRQLAKYPQRAVK
jgi:hypothetical protein